MVCSGVNGASAGLMAGLLRSKLIEKSWLQRHACQHRTLLRKCVTVTSRKSLCLKSLCTPSISSLLVAPHRCQHHTWSSQCAEKKGIEPESDEVR